MAPQSSASPPRPTVYLVAIDASPMSKRVLEVASGLGSALGGAAELHVLHVLTLTSPAVTMGVLPPMVPLDVEDGRRILDGACATVAERFQGRIHGHLTAANDAWGAITRAAANLDADLVIVGTAGKTGISRLVLGSVAEKVVRNAGCPVLVVRPKDYHVEPTPEIEPPCVECVRVQNETDRAQLWCTRHSTHHAHGRLHYEVPQSFAVGASLLRPEKQL